MTYEVKEVKDKKEVKTMIRCLNCPCKGDNWSATTQKHVQRLIDYGIFKEAK